MVTTENRLFKQKLRAVVAVVVVSALAHSMHLSLICDMICDCSVAVDGDKCCELFVSCCCTFVGTQRVISFLRQMVEHGGFYRTSDQAWVKFERIQFVGACNPPTDPGRKPLSHRSVMYCPHAVSVSCIIFVYTAALVCICCY